MPAPETSGNTTESETVIDDTKPHVSLENCQTGVLGINSKSEFNVTGINSMTQSEDAMGVNTDKPNLCVMGDNSATDPCVMGTNLTTQSGNVMDMHINASDTNKVSTDVLHNASAL